MSCTSPLAKHAKLSAPINNLADSDLEGIFKRLPSYERLIVSEVCRRWHAISRKSWLDICKIDLTPIPGTQIAAILYQCPNLQYAFTLNKTFDANDLTCLAKVPGLKRVSLIGCGFQRNPAKTSIEQNIFSDSLGEASWTELILHDAYFLAPQVTAHYGVVPLSSAFRFNVANLPASLTHLQLSGLRFCEEFHSESSLSLDGLERLENLERLILHFARGNPSIYAHELGWPALMEPNVFEKIARLKNLKELCFGPARLCHPTGLVNLVSSLPKLEVLFLKAVDGNDIAEDLAALIKSNSVLRVLVLSGEFCVVGESIELPARKRFPRGVGSDPLPVLHVFVDKQASENIRFNKSTSDAAIIHPINQPMPEFLERGEIEPIFKDVWVAEKIKEMARHGGKLWDYETHDTAYSIQHINTNA